MGLRLAKFRGKKSGGSYLLSVCWSGTTPPAVPLGKLGFCPPFWFRLTDNVEAPVHTIPMNLTKRSGSGLDPCIGGVYVSLKSLRRIF